jgi:hypothetical protein
MRSPGGTSTSIVFRQGHSIPTGAAPNAPSRGFPHASMHLHSVVLLPNYHLRHRRLTHIRLSLLPVHVHYRRPHKHVRSLRLRVRLLVLTVAIKAVVHIRTLATGDDIVARAERLHQAIDTQDLPVVAIERSAEAEAVAADSPGGWKALLSLFHADSRDELVTLLGFSKTEIAARVAEAIAKLRSAAEESTPLPVVKSPSDDDISDAKPHGPVVSFAEPERSLPVNADDLLDATPTEVSAGAASDTSIVTPLPDAAEMPSL